MLDPRSPAASAKPVAAATGAGSLVTKDVADGMLAAKIAELRRTHDIVVVHAPAVLAGVESLALANAVDHVLLAFRWERTPRGAIAEATEELARLHAPLSGLVMTGGSPGGALIIHFTAKTIYGVLNWGLTPQQAIDLPNFASLNGPSILEETIAIVAGNNGPTLSTAAIDPVSGALRFELPDGPSGPARSRPPREGRPDRKSQGRRGRPANIRHQGRRR